MKKFTLVRQQDQKDCGVSCLASVFKFYKTSVPIYKLREISGTDLNGTSAFGLKKCSEYFGFECKAIKTDESIWNEKEFPFPVIAHVVIDNSYLHYVVIQKIKKGKLVIADPAKGTYLKTIEEFQDIWTGILLLITPSKSYIPSKAKSPGISSFLPILFKQKGIIFSIVFMSLLITLFGIFNSYYFQAIIDFFIPNNTVSSLNIISFGLISVFVFQIFFEITRNYLLIIIGQRLSIDIMLSYFKHVLNLPMNFFSTRKSGEIISRFLDANKIIDALASASLSVLLDVGMVIIIGIVLFIQNVTLFLITLATLPFYMIVILFFVKLYDKANEEEMSASAKLNSSIIESLKGIETIKAYNNENEIYEKVDKEFVKLLKKSFFSAQLDNVQQGLKHGIQLISSILVLWIGSFFVMDGVITIGQLITYSSLLVFFTDPLQNIINLQVKMQTAKVANSRLNEIFFIKTEHEDKLEKRKINESIFSGALYINDLTFSYGTRAPVLKDVNIVIEPNSKTAIVGVSGSGKSTLAKLLVNFYQPNFGSISFDKINIQDIDRSFLREKITYVPQESFFFSGSILENLIFGLKKEIEFDKIIEICDFVDLTDFINSQPLRFDMQIEEGGVNLSGGQKQRLAIARALMRDSKIIILDEATSGMDTILEKKIVNNLLKIHDTTVIFIAHHLNIAKYCNQIIVMDKGESIENGTHEELLSIQGRYHELWDINI